MEQTTGNLQQDPGLFDIQIDGQSLEYFRESAKWAKFIAIVGFIGCGLMVLVGLFAGTIIAASMSMAMGAYSGLGGGTFTVIYLLFAAIWFFPCLYLYRFASQMQTALNSNEQEKLAGSLKNLKSYFRFIGILIIVMLGFYALAFVFGIIAAVAGFGTF